MSCTHILASHPAARHLEVVLSVVLGVKGVLRAGMEQRTHGLVTFKHQVDVPCKANAASLDSFSTTKPVAATASFAALTHAVLELNK